MTMAEFRRLVRERYPHVTVRIRASYFDGDRRLCLTIRGDRPGEAGTINDWARQAGILPDENVRAWYGDVRIA
jgi:hypothetical protein